MFIGHFAAALGAKKAAPKVSLGTLVASAQLVDLLWPVFLLLDIEHARIDPGNTAMTPLDFYDYPISHSLVAALGWSLIAGCAYFVLRRDRRSALVVGLCVFSHWILDFFTHRPDLPLGIGHSVFFGLGLWNSFIPALIIEISIFILGIALYAGATKAHDKIGSYGFWSFAFVLLAVHLINVFGPPPPTISAIAVAGNAMWLFVLWAYWVDRHRTSQH
jgi:hypothetical protein